MAKKNNKGFSFIEFMVVIAILGVAMAVTGGSISSIYGARSIKAAKTIDGMITQSKINAMSGRKNILMINYDKTKDVYCVGLHEAIKDPDGGYAKTESGEVLYNLDPYEYNEVGNSGLEATVSTTAGEIKLIDESGDSTGYLVMSFNADTGAVKRYVFCGSAASMEEDSKTVNGTQVIGIAPTFSTTAPKSVSWVDGKNTLTLKSYTVHRVTVYQTTGEHDFT